MGFHSRVPLQGRQYRWQMYFYYTNRSAHIYLAPGGNTPLLRHRVDALWIGLGVETIRMPIFT